MFDGIGAGGSLVWGSLVVVGSWKGESIRSWSGPPDWVSTRLLAFLPQLLVQFPSGCILQYQVDPLFVIKVSIESKYIWVPQVALDLNF